MCACSFAWIFAGSAAWAAPVKPSASEKPAKVFAKVDSKKQFSGERLFFVLDSLGEGGNWMEWDRKGLVDPSVKKALDAVGQGVEMVWVISERSVPLLAALIPQGGGEALVFFEIPKLDAKPESLKLNEVLDPDVVFRDYRQVSPTEFVHRDKGNLKIQVTESRIRFTYVNPDKEPLAFDPDFSKKTFIEKRAIVRDYMDFLKYEYSLMLRAFVQSTHGLFNWQPWHWYLPDWYSKHFIKADELEAILAKGVNPGSFSVFKAKTAKGEIVEFRANGNGFDELVISLP